MILLAVAVGVATLIVAPLAALAAAARFAYGLWQGRRLDQSREAS